jgi:hypothetical protein
MAKEIPISAVNRSIGVTLAQKASNRIEPPGKGVVE